MTDIEIINLVIAVYGAIVATASAVVAAFLGIAELRRNQPRLRVTTSTLQIYNPRTDKPGEAFLAISLANIGSRPINVRSYSFIDRRKHIIVLPDFMMKPVTLEDGQAHDFPIPVNVLAAKRFVKDIIAIRVMDSTGKAWIRKVPKAHKQWVLDMAQIK